MARSKITPDLYRYIAMTSEISGLLKDQAEKDITKAISQARDLLYRSAPFDEGGLRETITTAVNRYNRSVEGVIGYGSDEHPASFVEWGHEAPDGSKVAPVPAFYPTIKIVNKRFKAALRRNARKVLITTFRVR